MMASDPLKPIDYLVIGHITQDIGTQGARIGGTAIFSALTATALGLRVGIVTAWGEELPLPELDGIQIINTDLDQSTTFENLYIDGKRVQYLHHVAGRLDYYHVPEIWRRTPIVHLAPVAGEVESGMIRFFPESFIGLTPQGYYRERRVDGKVMVSDWPEASYILAKADAVVLSREDLINDDSRIANVAAAAQTLVVTNSAGPIEVFHTGQEYIVNPPDIEEVDPTGAGDIFATSFFVSFSKSKDALRAATFASQLASLSVLQPGVEGVPSRDDVYQLLTEVR